MCHSHPGGGEAAETASPWADGDGDLARNSLGSTHQSDMGCGTCRCCCFSILVSEFKVYQTQDAGVLHRGLSLFSVTEGCQQEMPDHLHEDKFQYWTQINSFSHSSFAGLV